MLLRRSGNSTHLPRAPVARGEAMGSRPPAKLRWRHPAERCHVAATVLALRLAPSAGSPIHRGPAGSTCQTRQRSEYEKVQLRLATLLHNGAIHAGA